MTDHDHGPCTDPDCTGTHQLGRVIEIGPLRVHELRDGVRPGPHTTIVAGMLPHPEPTPTPDAMYEFHVAISEAGDRLYLIRHDGSPLHILMLEEIIGHWLDGVGYPIDGIDAENGSEPGD